MYSALVNPFFGGDFMCNKSMQEKKYKKYCKKKKIVGDKPAFLINEENKYIC